MRLDEAIELYTTTLKSKYKEVAYVGNEAIKMRGNSTTTNFISTSVNLNTQVELIESRFDIEDEIDAVMLMFDVKLPQKRKFSRHWEYCRFV